jgi:uncharacterized protein YjdB
MKHNKIFFLFIVVVVFLFSCAPAIGPGSNENDDDNSDITLSNVIVEKVVIDGSFGLSRTMSINDSSLILNAMVYENNVPVPEKPVIWSSSNPSVASVNASTGRVTTYKTGDTIISAKSNVTNASDTFEVLVRSLDISIPTDDVSEEFDIAKGENLELIAILDPYHEHLNNAEVTWQVTLGAAYAKIEKINNRAILTTTSTDAGASIIVKATHDSVPNLSAIKYITVLAQPEEYITINEGNATMMMVADGYTYPLTADVYQKDTGILTGTQVYWSSSDESVATVDKNTGVVTPHKLGNATITASTTAPLSRAIGGTTSTFMVHVRDLVIDSEGDEIGLGLLSDLLSTLNLASLLDGAGLLEDGNDGGLLGGLLGPVLDLAGNLVEGLGLDGLLDSLGLENVLGLYELLEIGDINSEFKSKYGSGGLLGRGEMLMNALMKDGSGTESPWTDITWTLKESLNSNGLKLLTDVDITQAGVLFVEGALLGLDLLALGTVTVTATIPGTNVTVDKEIGITSLLNL